MRQPTFATSVVAERPARAATAVVEEVSTPIPPPRLSVAAQAGLLAGPFLSMVDANIVNVALPDIAEQLRSPLSTVQWVVSGYLLALGAALAASAFLAKRFGTRRVYLVSLLCFTVASGLCALAPGIVPLIALRALQGAVGAPLVPLAMTLLLAGGGPDRRMPPAAGIVLFLAPALGPTLGGLVLPLAGWPAIFLVNVPVGLIGFLGMRTVVEGSDPGDPDVRFDPVGLLLLAAGLTLTLYGAAQGPTAGWVDAGTWPFLAAGTGLIVAYVPWSLRRAHPALDLQLLRRPQTALAIGLSGLASIVMFAVLFLIPVFMQTVQGRTPFEAGLALLPQGVAMGLGTVLGEKLPARYGVRRCVALGMAVLAISTAALLTVRADSPPWLIAGFLSGRGLALGLTIQPLLHAMLGGLGRAQVADASTLFNVAQRLAGSVGISLVASFFQLREQARVARVLGDFGLSPAALGAVQGTSASFEAVALPAPVRQALAGAAAEGLHDVVWLLVGLAVLGVAAAVLLPGRRTAAQAPLAGTAAAP